MLNSRNLQSDIEKAFKKGIKTKKINDFTQKAMHKESDVASDIADAIVDYASQAEIKFFPGPFLYPNPVLTPPVLPDLGAPFQKGKPTSAKLGKPILLSAIISSFKAQDPTFGPLAAALPIYAATLAVYKSPRFDMATGVTSMNLPPIFTQDIKTNKSKTDSMEAHASMLASTIHSSFKSCTFQGIAITVSILGAGPVISPLL